MSRAVLSTRRSGADAAAVHRDALLCIICRIEPARLRSTTCAQCVWWCRYWRSRNQFQFRRYQGRVEKARSRIGSFKQERPSEGAIKRAR